MSTTTIYGLPGPDLPGQADGPAAFAALNAKLETTLGNLARTFVQAPGDFLFGSGTHDTAFTAVPLGRPTLLVVSFVSRITSSAGQYCVYQLFDGVTKVSTDYAVGGSGTTQIVIPVTMVVCRTWSAAPVLRATAGGGGDAISTEGVQGTGIGFAWPS